MEKASNGSVLDPNKDTKNTEVQASETVKTESGNGGILRKFETKKEMNKKPILYTLISIVVILAGVGSGYLLSNGLNAKESSSSSNSLTADSKNVNEAGEISDDYEGESPEGILREGGIEGEGTHKLERGLGPEKDVYLFSTSIVLDPFVGKEVKVWGETVSSEAAGWLMDVSKIEVIN